MPGGAVTESRGLLRHAVVTGATCRSDQRLVWALSLATCDKQKGPFRSPLVITR